MTVGRLVRIGNSLGVIIPKRTLEEAGWWEGDVIKQQLSATGMVLKNLTQKPVKPVRTRKDQYDPLHEIS